MLGAKPSIFFILWAKGGDKTMASPDIQLLFGVLGGGSLSGVVKSKVSYRK